MAAFAYLLLPLSGTVAYLVGRTERVRFHGLQAIVVGALWGIVVYAASWVSPVVTRAVFALGGLAWLGLLLLTLGGRDVRLPGLGFLTVIAAEPDRD